MSDAEDETEREEKQTIEIRSPREEEKERTYSNLKNSSNIVISNSDAL